MNNVYLREVLCFSYEELMENIPEYGYFPPQLLKKMVDERIEKAIANKESHAYSFSVLKDFTGKANAEIIGEDLYIRNKDIYVLDIECNMAEMLCCSLEYPNVKTILNEFKDHLETLGFRVKDEFIIRHIKTLDGVVEESYE